MYWRMNEILCTRYIAKSFKIGVHCTTTGAVGNMFNFMHATIMNTKYHTVARILYIGHSFGNI